MTGKLALEFVLENDNSGMEAGRNMAAVSNDFRQKNMFDSANPTFRNRRNSRTNVATSYNDVEFEQPKPIRRKTAGPKVQYVDPPKKSRKRKKAKATTRFEWTWSKVGWLVCAALIGRLVLMDRGLIDFNSMDNTITEKQQELEELKLENQDITAEIHKIRTSPRYQRKIARDHLGVIAKGEYLVLFSKDHR